MCSCGYLIFLFIHFLPLFFYSLLNPSTTHQSINPPIIPTTRLSLSLSPPAAWWVLWKVSWVAKKGLLEVVTCVMKLGS